MGMSGIRRGGAMNAEERARALARFRLREQVFEAIAEERARRLGDEVVDCQAELRCGSSPRVGALLTEREIEVLQFVARGFGNSEIAGRLGISEETVKTHVRRVLARLGARNRAHAVALGMADGLLGAPRRTD